MLGSPEEEAAAAATTTSEERGERLIRDRRLLDLLELMWSVDAAVKCADGRILTIPPPTQVGAYARGPD